MAGLKNGFRTWTDRKIPRQIRSGGVCETRSPLQMFYTFYSKCDTHGMLNYRAHLVEMLFCTLGTCLERLEVSGNRNLHAVASGTDWNDQARRAIDKVHSDLVPIRRSNIFKDVPILERSNPSYLFPLLRYPFRLYPTRVLGDRAVVQVDRDPTESLDEVFPVVSSRVVVSRSFDYPFKHNPARSRAYAHIVPVEFAVVINHAKGRLEM